LQTIALEKESRGIYKFSYNFDEGGAYYLKVNVFSSSIGNQQALFNINIFNDMGGGGGVTQTPILSYVIFGIIGIGIIIALYFVFKRR